MTERPGPRTHGHGASLQVRPDAEWVLARPLRQPRRGQPRPLKKPARKDPSSLSMIVRRSPASSSFVPAATRLRRSSLTPPARRREPGSCEEDPKNSQASPATPRKSRVNPPCPLDTNGPYGCRVEFVILAATRSHVATEGVTGGTLTNTIWMPSGYRTHISVKPQGSVVGPRMMKTTFDPSDKAWPRRQ